MFDIVCRQSSLKTNVLKDYWRCWNDARGNSCHSCMHLSMLPGRATWSRFWEKDSKDKRTQMTLTGYIYIHRHQTPDIMW